MNVQESTNYVTVLRKVNKSDITNIFTDGNTINENSVVQMVRNQYDCLHSWSTLSTQFKMRDSYNNHDIIIVDFLPAKHQLFLSPATFLFCREK